MATSNDSMSSSVTYIKGTIGDIIVGTEIVLYKHKPGLEKISITNLDEVLNEVLKENSKYGGYTSLKRSGKDEDYIYSRINVNSLGDSGFNTIIYLSPTNSNEPIGYTEFLTAQGIIPKEVSIKLDFEATSEVGVDKINIFNSFSSVREFKSISKRLISNKLGGFTSIFKVEQEIGTDKTFSRYTREVNNLFENPENSILLDFGLATKDGLYRLDLIKEMTIAEDFEHYQLGYYKGEIVLYAWKTKNQEIVYLITSLSRKDKFGNPISYTNTPEGTKSLSNVPNLKSAVKSINYFSGRFASVHLESGHNAVIDVFDSKLVLQDEKASNISHIIDLWSPYSHVIELPSVLNKTSLMEHLPETKDLYINVPGYTTLTIKPVKKIGEWYVFREVAKNLDSTSNSITLNYLIYTNFTKTIRICEEYDEEPIPINNNLLLLRSKETIGNTTYDYYTYFTADGDYCSENYLMAKDLIDGVKKPAGKFYYQNFGCVIYSKTKYLASKAENYNNYSEKKLLIDKLGDNLLDSYIFGFRRNTCPENLEVPEIIGAINGLIYYKEGNKIKLL